MRMRRAERIVIERRGEGTRRGVIEVWKGKTYVPASLHSERGEETEVLKKRESIVERRSIFDISNPSPLNSLTADSSRLPSQPGPEDTPSSSLSLIAPTPIAL